MFLKFFEMESHTEYCHYVIIMEYWAFTSMWPISIHCYMGRRICCMSGFVVQWMIQPLDSWRGLLLWGKKYPENNKADILKSTQKSSQLSRWNKHYLYLLNYSWTWLCEWSAWKLNICYDHIYTLLCISGK